MSDYLAETTPTPSSPATPTTSSADADWRDALHYLGTLSTYRYISQWPAGDYPGERTASMARHPAGKARLDDMSQFEEDVSEVLFEMQDVLVSKQQDYGPRSINDSPEGPLTGINVRMHDKLSRAQNLRRSGVATNHESLRDTYLDLANYAVIAVMLLSGTWPA